MLRNLYLSPFLCQDDQIGDDNGHVTRSGEVRIAYKMLIRRSEKEGTSLNISIGAKMILKRMKSTWDTLRGVYLDQF